MRIVTNLLTILILLTNCQIFFSQEKDKNFILLNSSHRLNGEDLSSRIDILAYEINEIPNSIGYIIIYGGSDKIENAFNKQNVVRSIKTRDYSQDKIMPLSTIDFENPRFEFWISKNGNPPIIKKEANPYILPNADNAFSFVESVIAKGKINGMQDYYVAADCKAGCYPILGFVLLSNFLDENQDINAFVIVHAKNIKTAKEVKKFLARKSLEDANISPNRMSFLFSSKNKIESNKFSEVKVYLASDDSKLPKSASIKYKPL